MAIHHKNFFISQNVYLASMHQYGYLNLDRELVLILSSSVQGSLKYRALNGVTFFLKSYEFCFPLPPQSFSYF